MPADAPAAGDTPFRDPIPDNLFREPVDYLFADHVRQRAVCRLLTTLSMGAGIGADFPLADALSYLETDHVNHMADEDEELFPKLRERFARDGGVLRLLDELEAEHRCEVVHGRAVVAALRRFAKGGGQRISDDLRASLDEFIARVMNHLAVEDARLLPLARTSLSDADLEQMGRAMARRRGVDYPC